MKEEKNIIANTESSEIYDIDAAEYIMRRTKEVMKNYPHLDECRIMDDVKSCFDRDKEVFDSIEQGDILYKMFCFHGESMFEKYRIIRKFIKDNRFVVEASSAWFDIIEETDIAELLTESEIKEEDEEL